MNHNGEMDTARQMILTAARCGASAVKGQAFLPGDVKGSMPLEFYEQRTLSLMELVELVDFGTRVNIPVFFSIFSKAYDSIRSFQKYHKFSASQSRTRPRVVEANDKTNVFVSVNPLTLLPDVKYAQVMYACPYLTTEPRLDYINFLKKFYGRQVGYSDHTVGIDACVSAVEDFGAHVIEKHFTLTRDIFHKGKQFRDAIHGATPLELEMLARRIK